jgi:integral membrane protein (TIGR01906 family)
MADHALPQSTPRISRGSRALILLLRYWITISIPILLTLISVRAVMTPLFIQAEYYRPGFPEDPYGFTHADRLEYAPYALGYLFNSAGIDYLGDLTFPDGSSLFNARELRHMEDVKVVTRQAFTGLAILAAMTTLCALYLLRDLDSRRDLRLAVGSGGALTLAIIGTIVFSAMLAWDFFFTTFHQIFFESGTWRFAYSDTLIRLFPEPFWFDAALTIGVLTALGATALLVMAWRWGVIASRESR